MRSILHLYTANLSYRFARDSTRFVLETIGRLLVWLLLWLLYWSAGSSFSLLEQKIGVSPTEAILWLSCFQIIQRGFFQKFFVLDRVTSISLPKSKIAAYYILASIVTPFSLAIPIFALSSYGQVGAPVLLLFASLIAVLFNSFIFLYTSFSFNSSLKYLSQLAALVLLVMMALGRRNLVLSPQNEFLILLGLSMALTALFARLYLQLKKKISYRDLSNRSIPSLQISAEGWFWDEWKMLTRNRRFNALIYLPVIVFLAFPPIYIFSGIEFPEGSGPLLGFALSGGFILSYWLQFPAWESTYFSLLMISPRAFEEVIFKKYLFILTITFVPVALLMVVFAFVNGELSLQIGTAYLVANSLLFYSLLLNAPNNTQRLELDESGFFNQKGIKLSHYLFIALILLVLQFWPNFSEDLAEETIYYIWFATLALSGLSLLLLRVAIRFCAGRIKRKRYQLIRSYHDKSK